MQCSGALDTRSSRSSGDRYQLIEEGTSGITKGLQHLSYSRTYYSGETYNNLWHSYEIEFYDNETAKRFYSQVAPCVARYAARWDGGIASVLAWHTSTCIKPVNFPVFMAAFTVLASDPVGYGVPQSELARFRAVAPLGALPDPLLIGEKTEPGTLVPKNDGSGHWAMSSVLERALAAVKKAEAAHDTDLVRLKLGGTPSILSSHTLFTPVAPTAGAGKRADGVSEELDSTHAQKITKLLEGLAVFHEPTRQLLCSSTYTGNDIRGAEFHLRFEGPISLRGLTIDYLKESLPTISISYQTSVDAVGMIKPRLVFSPAREELVSALEKAIALKRTEEKHREKEAAGTSTRPGSGT